MLLPKVSFKTPFRRLIHDEKILAVLAYTILFGIIFHLNQCKIIASLKIHEIPARLPGLVANPNTTRDVSHNFSRQRA